MNTAERTYSELFAAEAKLQRAINGILDHDGNRYDPISGFSLKDIVEWLDSTPKGKIILRRNGVEMPFVSTN